MRGMYCGALGIMCISYYYWQHMLSSGAQRLLMPPPVMLHLQTLLPGPLHFTGDDWSMLHMQSSATACGCARANCPACAVQCHSQHGPFTSLAVIQYGWTFGAYSRRTCNRCHGKLRVRAFLSAVTRAGGSRLRGNASNSGEQNLV